MSFPLVESLDSVTLALRAAGCVWAEDEAGLLVAAAATPAELTALVAERVAGRPLEQLLGWVGFCGLRISVAPGVFVPRRRTELLAAQAVRAATGPNPVVVELCCGSGAIGAAVLAALPAAELHAVDIDPAAVRCARGNLTGTVYRGDLYRPLPTRLRGRVEVLVANAPYVPTGAIRLLPPEARLHEAPVALDGGADGLDVLRAVLAQARSWLSATGTVLVEAGPGQVPALARAARGAGLLPQVVTDPDLDATVLIATVL